MKWNVMGFNQQRAVELGLSAEDLLILRWFTDFQGTKRMKRFQDGEESFSLVSYKYFLKDMPIFKCSKRTLASKFRHLVDADVLKYQLVKDSGTFSAYGFGPNYDGLVYGDPNEDHQQLTKNGGGCQENSNGLLEKQQRVAEKTATKDPSTIDPSAKDHDKENIKEDERIADVSHNKSSDAPRQTKTFMPPTVEEVKAYCKDRSNHVDPQKFIDFYETNGWVQGKARKPIKSWKACVRTWEGQDKDSDVSADHTKRQSAGGNNLW